MPDLVFNELKFLRDSHEHQDERRPDRNGHRPTGQEKKREFEREEISAYFNHRTSHDRAPNPSRGGRTETKQNPSCNDEELHDVPEGGSSPILPDEELTSIPYLGFGSRGTVNKSGDPHPSGTTYLTWSESAAASDTQTRHSTIVKPIQESGQPPTAKETRKRRRERHSTSRPPSDTAEHPVLEGPPDVPKGKWSTSRRTRGPAKVEVYIQQSNGEPDPSTSKRKLRDSTSVSLPTRPPAEAGRQRHHKPVIQQQVLSSDVGSFNTSDILEVRGRLQALVEKAPSSTRNVQSPQSDKENVQPISSSPTAKILRIAHEAMAKGHGEPTARPSRGADKLYGHVDAGHDTDISENGWPRPHRPHLRGLDINEFAYQPMHTHATVREQGPRQQVQHGAEIAPAAGFDPEDDEMLDGYATFEPTFADHANATSEYGPAYTYGAPATEPDLHSLPFRYERPSTRARDVPWSRGGMSTIHRDTSSYVTTADQGLLNDEYHIGDRDRDFEDGLEGFWRPNRLY